jgi:hypothetical protein
MELHASRWHCRCARPYPPRSTTLLFLALVLPASSVAQLTTSLSQTARVPTTLLTSHIPSSTSSSLPTIRHVQAAPTQTPPPKGATTEESHAFNYYFLIIAGFVIVISFCVLYIGRQKRRKAALVQTRGQRALARDVEGWRSRFGVGRTGIGRTGIGRAGAYNSNIHDINAEDGLNERGEAPPPYVPGSKPPSINSEDLQRPSTAASSHLHGESVELTNMEPNSNPPGYNERLNRRSGDESPDANITRPGPVLTASERRASIMRPASSSGSPNHP